MRHLTRLVSRIREHRGPGGQEAIVSVDVTIVVLWMAFPIGLACVASGRIGRALAKLRQLES